MRSELWPCHVCGKKLPADGGHWIKKDAQTLVWVCHHHQERSR